jgi:HK97 family phage major capsid protein
MITDLAQAEAELLKHQAMLVQFIEKANTETASQGKMNAETRATVEKLAATCITMTDRCIKLEQKITDFLNPENPLFGGRKAGSTIDIGGEFVKSDGYKALANGPQLGGSHRMMFKTAIINATGTLQPLVPPDYKPAIITAPLRRLRMRDVMTVGQTDSNMISFPKENVFTNNAGPQISGSPQQFENVTKPESAITFTLANEPVCTIAHWIPASKQVLADAPMLASYINGRLMYGLKLKEDTEILLGTGAIADAVHDEARRDPRRHSAGGKQRVRSQRDRAQYD